MDLHATRILTQLVLPISLCLSTLIAAPICLTYIGSRLFGETDRHQICRKSEESAFEAVEISSSPDEHFLLLVNFTRVLVLSLKSTVFFFKTMQ